MNQPHFNINRRLFLKGATAAAVLSSFGAYGMELMHSQKTWRVGLIGTGWYGKSDLFRLIQIAPIEVISLCDVDQHLLEEAATLVSQRQKSGKKPRTYRDYRKMLAEKDLDIVLIGSPDHWHALQAIAALESGANVYVQKPISVDVLEGEAMVAAAEKSGKVVQVGTQRRNTPHLIEAKKNIIDTGMLGNIHHAEVFCYYHMRADGNPPLQPIPDYFDYEMWTGPAPYRPFDGMPHRRWWRTFMEYGNGIMGDMCIHMLDTVRWMTGLQMPHTIQSSGGIYVQKGGKSNIADTQNAVFEFEDFQCVWQHRSWGAAPDPEYPWGFKLYGDKGTFTGSVMQYDFAPLGAGKPIHGDVIYEREKYPEDVTEKDIELHAAPATRLHMMDFISAITENRPAQSNMREGHISTASCILANLSMELQRPLKYDWENHIIPGDTEATSLLKRKYRGPWEHPYS